MIARSRCLPLLLCVLCACAQGGVPEPKPQPQVKAGGVRAYEVRVRETSAPETMIGDFVLQGRGLRIAVDGATHAERRGALVELAQDGAAYDWEELTPLLSVDGALRTVHVDRIRVEQRGGRACLVVQGTAGAYGRGQLQVERVLRLSDVNGVVRVSTRAWASSKPAPKELIVVERVAWGGGAPLAPLEGPLRAEQPVDADWIARVADARAVVVAALSGAVQATGHAADHGRVDLLRDTDLRLPTTLDKQHQAHAEAVISMSGRGLSQAVRQLGWVRNRAFVDVTAQLDISPPGVSVQLSEVEGGRPIVSGVPDDTGRVLLPVPAALVGKALSLVALAHGLPAGDPLVVSGPPYAPVQLKVAAGSSLEVRAEQLGTGDPLPVRIRVLSRRGTPAPDFGPDWSAAGAGDTVIAPNGHATLGLPAGYYRVIVAHGPEWTLLDTQVELDVGKTTQVRARLERAIDPGAWVACELHVHAAPSPDSQVALEDRVASLVAEGIVFAIPTDHNHVTDLGEAIRAQPLWGMTSIPGVEVTTAEPSYGHFNAFPFLPDPDKPGRGAPEFIGVEPADLFNGLHELDQAIVVQVNHPRLEGGIGYFTATDFDPMTDRGGDHYSSDYDTLEVWNGFDLARRPNVARVFDEWLELLAHGHRVVATGSSDSHTIRSEGAGYPRTYIRPELGGVVEPYSLLRALRAGRAFVTSGPFLSVRVGDAGPGDEVVVRDKRVVVEIRAQVPAWMSLSTLRVHVGNKLVSSGPIGAPATRNGVGTRYERTLPLTLAELGPLVVEVEGDQPLEPFIARRGVPPLAFSNPIWLVTELTPKPEPPPAPTAETGTAGSVAP